MYILPHEKLQPQPLYHFLELVVRLRARQTNVERDPHRRRQHVHLHAAAQHGQINGGHIAQRQLRIGGQPVDFRAAEATELLEYRGDFLAGGVAVHQRTVTGGARTVDVQNCAADNTPSNPLHA